MNRLVEIGDGDKIVVAFPGEKVDMFEVPVSVDVVYVPKKAKVTLEQSHLNWGGNQGYTYFVIQDPPVHIFRPATKIRNPQDINTSDFLGGQNNPHFSPDGTFNPSNLPDIISEVKGWGWEIDPQIFKLLSIQGQALNTIGKKMSQQKKVK